MPKCNKPLLASIFLTMREMEKRGIIENPNEADVEKFVNKVAKQLASHNKEMQKFEKEEAEMPFTMNIIPKSMLMAINFEEELDGIQVEVIPKSKKEILLLDRDIDVDVSTVEITKEMEQDIIAEGFEALNFMEFPMQGEADEVIKLYIPGHREVDTVAKLLLHTLNKVGAEKHSDEYTSEHKAFFGPIAYNLNNRSWHHNTQILIPVIASHVEFINEGILTVGGESLSDAVLTIDENFYKRLVDALVKEREKSKISVLNEEYPEAFDPEYWRETMREVSEAIVRDVTTKIIVALGGLKGNFKHGRDELVSLFFNATDNGQDLKRTKKSEFNFSLKLPKKSGTAPLRIPYTKKTGGKEALMLDRFKISKKRLNEETLSEYDIIPLHSQTETFSFNGKVLFREIEIEEDAPKFHTTNQMMGRDYYYSKQMLEQFRLVTNDESDIGKAGGTAETFRNIAKKADNIVTSSGTAISGKPGDFAYQLGNRGIDRHVIQQNAARLTELCGIYSLSSDILKQAMLYDTGSNLVTLYYEANGAKSKTFDLKQESKKTAYHLIRELDRHTDVSGIVPSKAGRDVFMLIRSALLASEPIQASDNSSFIKEVVRKSLAYTKVENDNYRPPVLLKEKPGLQNGVTYINAVAAAGGGNSSIMTRKRLKGRDETIEFDDRAAFLATKKEIAKEDDFLEEKASVDIDAALMFDFLRQYGSDHYIADLHYICTSGFNTFVDSLNPKKTPYAASNIALVIPEGMTPRRFEDLLVKSTKTSTDDMGSFYRTYINNNGSLDAVEKNYTNKEKIELFKWLLEKAQRYYFDNMTEIYETVNSSEEPLEFIEINGFKFAGEMNIPETLYNRTTGDEIAFVGNDEFQFYNGYPHVVGDPVMFSVDLVLDRPAWKKFVHRAPVFHYEFHNRETASIAERYTTTGVKNMLEHRVGKHSEKVVMASDRTMGSVINLYEYIEVLANRSDKTRPYILVVNNMGNKELTEATRGIDQSFLRKNAIIIEEASSQIMQVLVNNCKSKGETIQGYGVVSNYIAISRGLDLSDMHYISAAGWMLRPNEAIQMIARLFSVDRDYGTIGIHNGGRDVALQNCFIDGEPGNGAKSVVPGIASHVLIDNLVTNREKDYPDRPASVPMISFTDSAHTAKEYASISKTNIRIPMGGQINDSFYYSYETYDGFMDGTLADLKKTNPIEKIFTPASGYMEYFADMGMEDEEIIEIDAEQEAYGYAQ